MRISQAIYRTRQFWLAWRAPSLKDHDLASACKILTAEQMQLFSRLQPSEQVHALRVLQTVQQHGERDPDLHAAALLHDIGKVRAPLRLWERVLIVLVRGFFPKRARIWGYGQCRGWRRPFVVAEQHPVWGGQMAAEVGATPLAASLIRRHQSPNQLEPVSPGEDRLLEILQQADHQN
jgi:hypothetical protein